MPVGFFCGRRVNGRTIQVFKYLLAAFSCCQYSKCYFEGQIGAGFLYWSRSSNGFDLLEDKNKTFRGTGLPCFQLLSLSKNFKTMFGGNFFTFVYMKVCSTCRFRTVRKLLWAGYAEDASGINHLEEEEMREEVIVPLWLSKLYFQVGPEQRRGSHSQSS